MRQKHKFNYIKIFGLKMKNTLENEESYKMSLFFKFLITILNLKVLVL